MEEIKKKPEKSLVEVDGAPVWKQEEIRGKIVTYMLVEKPPIELWPKNICNEKQLEILRAIAEFRQKNGYMPTYRELMKSTGKALNTVVVRINELVSLGLVEYDGGRQITLVGETYIPPIPLRSDINVQET